MAKPPHVALLIETSWAYGRGLLRGVARYMHERGPWSVYLRPQGLGDAVPPWLERWRGDGILARIDNRRMARAVLRTRLPVVDVRNALTDLRLPGIGPDNRMVAELACRHFLDSGLRNFGFGTARRGQNRFLDARCDCFRAMVETAGHRCHVYRPYPIGRRPTWEQEQSRLAQWLQSLPKPIGIMTGDDDQGLQLLDACLRAALRVPDQVAVVSVNNDEHLCGLSNPPLSSIDVNPERIGYEAAAMLDRLMSGRKAPKAIVELPPRGLVVRPSSDVVGVEEPLVADAVRMIRRRAVEPLSVAQLAAALDVSRSTLERRFAAMLGRTPKQEILRVRLSHAQELLVSTDLPLATVAERTGFRSAAHFCEVFHDRMECTPGDYRRRHGPGRFS
ncbi:MAG: XylR family transcriptional regulator [Thermoguttaceae bacterium]